MKGISATAFFCEDIRKESGNRETLLGVFGAGIRAEIPGTLLRFACFLRMRLELDESYSDPITVRVQGLGAGMEPEVVPADVIQASVKNARKYGNPYAIVIARFSLHGMPIESEGRITVHIKSGDVEEVCGFLNVRQRTINDPNASEPLSEQSPPASAAS